MIDTSYEQCGTRKGLVSRNLRFELISANSVSLSHEMFSPENQLQDGDNVEYKIPMQAKMNLDFLYRPGSTIEQQALKQDLLEMQVHHISPHA
jgi:hypothetical protein